MEVKVRLAHPVCQKLLELSRLEREFETAMSLRREALRRELEAVFGRVSKDDRLEVIRQEVENYSDEVLAAAFGVSVLTIWECRSRAGIKRDKHKKLSPEQRKLVEAMPESAISQLAVKLGLGVDHLKAIKRAQRKARAPKGGSNE